MVVIRRTKISAGSASFRGSIRRRGAPDLRTCPLWRGLPSLSCSRPAGRQGIFSVASPAFGAGTVVLSSSRHVPSYLVGGTPFQPWLMPRSEQVSGREGASGVEASFPTVLPVAAAVAAAGSGFDPFLLPAGLLAVDPLASCHRRWFQTYSLRRPSTSLCSGASAGQEQGLGGLSAPFRLTLPCFLTTSGLEEIVRGGVTG
jgi:hypothetical protein